MRQQVIPRRNIATDRDSYEIKYPAATIILAGLALIAYEINLVRNDVFSIAYQ